MQNLAFSRLVASRVRMYCAESGFPGALPLTNITHLAGKPVAYDLELHGAIEELLVEIRLFRGAGAVLHDSIVDGHRR
ncbi:hypothetical protein [Caballeronia zhejiangensis]|uniref:hypothetical protein n=1 Tax=Caballeronia zhejiangensis TaxID=871203 RepID=UPI001F518BDB|nr:hypothetical protein [Caballeronia zhejiangensis]MCI1047062.1 hypothetical protein [Caballeronia zhejiangensis]